MHSEKKRSFLSSGTLYARSGGTYFLRCISTSSTPQPSPMKLLSSRSYLIGLQPQCSTHSSIYSWLSMWCCISWLVSLLVLIDWIHRRYLGACRRCTRSPICGGMWRYYNSYVEVWQYFIGSGVCSNEEVSAHYTVDEMLWQSRSLFRDNAHLRSA